jgi:hypothetical protein
VTIAQLPWAILFLRGAGALRAIAAACLSLAFTTLLLDRARVRWVGMALAFGATLAPPIAGIVIGAPLAISSGISTWRHGAEPRSVITFRLPRVAPLAMMGSFVLLLLRLELVRLVLGLSVLASGRALASLLERNGSLDHSAIVLAPSTAIAMGILAPPLVRHASQLRWVLVRSWYALACASALSAVIVVAFAPSCAPIAFGMLALAERALRRSWEGASYGLAVVAAAACATVLWRLACS